MPAGWLRPGGKQHPDSLKVINEVFMLMRAGLPRGPRSGGGAAAASGSGQVKVVGEAGFQSRAAQEGFQHRRGGPAGGSRWTNPPWKTAPQGAEVSLLHLFLTNMVTGR